ncbi:MAG TPA: hypothetical protein DDX29_05815 [Clostridiales bacterium]|nr:hypothetical protein [Clostridiales bacterium]
MGKIYHKQDKPGPGVKFSLIDIPDDQKLGSGRYTTVLEPSALAKKQPVVSIILNAPVFQLSVNINPQTKEIPVLLGKVDGSNPISNVMFSLPENVSLDEEYVFITEFDNWQVQSLSMNNVLLERKVRPGTITFWFDPQKNMGAFTDGINVNWGTFNCNGEVCTIVSEGRTLVAYLNKDSANESMIFSQELDVDPSKSHMVAITWSNTEMTLYFDGQQECKIDLK